jgi:hypothetical protein
MWPFKQRSPLSVDDEEWQFETWRWLIEQLGGVEDLRARPLVTPTREFFPPTEAQGHQRAEHVFAATKKLMGLQDWHCKLAAQPEGPDPKVSEVAYLKFEKDRRSPLGTVLITYDPKLVNDPVGLVATLAHELAHYLLSHKGAPPGGWDNHEFCTDLAVVYTGFGLFGTATAFRYFAGQQSWGYSKAGYLTQPEWTFALAIFLAIRGQSVAETKSWLPSHLLSGTARAAKYLSSKPERIEALKSHQAKPQQFQTVSYKVKLNPSDE